MLFGIIKNINTDLLVKPTVPVPCNDVNEGMENEKKQEELDVDQEIDFNKSITDLPTS